MNGALKSKRSTNEGQSFGTTVTHTTTAVGPGTVACTATIALTRTSAGVWVLAWNDIRDDDGLVQRSDVYARSSTDGATWGAEVRVDGGAAGAAQSSLGAIAAVSTNDVVLVYRDARDNPRSFNLYCNRSVANPLAFGPDARIDADAGMQSPRGMTDIVMANDGAGSVYSAVSGFATYLHGRNDVVVTTDGAGHVYAAFSAFVHGAFTDVFVATSHDGGHSFGTPVRVGGFPAGTMMAFFPVIAAEPGGHVYIVLRRSDRAPAPASGSGKSASTVRRISARRGSPWTGFSIPRWRTPAPAITRTGTASPSRRSSRAPRAGCSSPGRTRPTSSWPARPISGRTSRRRPSIRTRGPAASAIQRPA